ncbi:MULTISPECIES: sensor domain-containing diguanylate cyclase [unclassified Rhizobacter]|uniref:sensor domain-containing diguanylate cyclase n=1 Tax=unclassified Rhizobacter TaxID=2640088 RepID=UPI0006FB073C|nr:MULTISPECIES: sensor domain-containing diguanylate cyclase [unclassified Rhizobacter]KQU64507.1 diguanylate cyclase [Rhizobacter sp. Root29]KQW11562.1 diguanylate cyclase [Rhizobacter sp. Root1238]KRB19818.1 diguanylate cyclase [Rhizobacter sp. Root16D2]
MTETKPLAVPARVDNARALTASLGLAPQALGALVFTLADRLDAPLAIKEIASGRYVYANGRMDTLVGRTADGLTDEDWLDPAQAATLRTADQSAMVQTLPQVSEHRIERKGGRREFSVTRQALAAQDGGAPRYLCCLWLDQTTQRQHETQLQLALQQLEQQQQASEAFRREMQDQGLRDTVTGLYQRAHFDDQLRREVDLSSREHREFALVSVSLDPLADEVKALGPEARQRVLEALGRLLRSNTRAMDASCRLEEDLFAVLLSGVGLATAHARMEGLRRQCATQIVMLNGRDLGFTVSMGVASFPHTAHTQEELLNAADAALAEARRRGGNHVTLASIRFEMS